MTDVVFRGAPEPKSETKQSVPLPPKDDTNIISEPTIDEPLELMDSPSRSIVLEALNIDENVNSLPQEDIANLEEVEGYITQIMEDKGLPSTFKSFQKTLETVKAEIGLDKEADPSIIIERIAGITKAWRRLPLVDDEDERRRIFVKLANAKSTEEMNKIVFRLLEDYKVWQ